MTGLFFTLLFVVAVVLGLRFLRKREIERFMDADMVDFQTFKQQQKSKPDPVQARVEAFATLNPNVVTLKTPDQATADGETLTDEIPRMHPEPALFVARSQAFDEITARVFTILKSVLPKQYVALKDVTLSDFIRVESSGDAAYKLSTVRIAYLICGLPSLQPVCGMILKDGDQNQEFIRSAFKDLNLPLLQLPATVSLSEAEVRDEIEPVLLSQEDRKCPRCDQSMAIRRATKGKNAGNTFWVCTDFPGCRGIIRV